MVGVAVGAAVGVAVGTAVGFAVGSGVEVGAKVGGGAVSYTHLVLLQLPKVPNRTPLLF